MRTLVFADRRDAGRALASALAPLWREPSVVVAIPRGGALVAAPVAERFHAPLTLVFVRKLSLAQAPEYAIGALDEAGNVTIDDSRVDDLVARSEDLATTRARVAAEIARQKRVFAAPRLRDFLPRCRVVLIDDGLATGHTLLGAIAHLRRLGAKHVTVAVPCAARSSAARVRKASDEFVCPVVDDDFMAVGGYYRDFATVEDAQVQQVLEQAATRMTP